MAGFVLAAGSSNRPLFQAIADRLQTKIVELYSRPDSNGGVRLIAPHLLKTERGDLYDLRFELDTYERFADGEGKYHYADVRTATFCHFIIVTATQTAEDWEELDQMIDASRRGGATHISVVLTYFGTARQDRKDEPHVAITAAKNIRRLQNAGVWRVVLLDPHNVYIQGVFDGPCDIMYARQVLVKHLLLKMQGVKRGQLPVLYSVDVGGDKMVDSYLKRERLPWQRGFGFKIRRGKNEVAKAVNMGPARDRHVMFLDDMVDTAGSAVKQAHYAKKRGARRITLVAIHALLSAKAAEVLAASPIDEFIFTNSVAISQEKLALIERAGKQVTVLDLSNLLSSTVLACNGEGSMTKLLNQ